MPHVAPDDLLRFAAGLYEAVGLRRADAETMAEVLVQADLHGYPGHGVAHIPSYLDRIASGQTRIDAQVRVVREGKTTAVLDADFAIGQLAGRWASPSRRRGSMESGSSGSDAPGTSGAQPTMWRWRPRLAWWVRSLSASRAATPCPTAPETRSRAPTRWPTASPARTTSTSSWISPPPR